jgi:hypothetical protein
MAAAARRNFKDVRRWSNEDSPDPKRLSRWCVGTFGGEAGSYFIPFVGSVAAEYGSALRLERAYMASIWKRLQMLGFAAGLRGWDESRGRAPMGHSVHR